MSYTTTIYEKVPENNNDIYVITQEGDRLDNLAFQYYGDPKLWWAIAWFNEKPTEAHLKLGQLILVPIPVEKVISYFNYGTI